MKIYFFMDIYNGEIDCNYEKILFFLSLRYVFIFLVVSFDCL